MKYIGRSEASTSESGQAGDVHAYRHSDELQYAESLRIQRACGTHLVRSPFFVKAILHVRCAHTHKTGWCMLSTKVSDDGRELGEALPESIAANECFLGMLCQS